MQSDKQHRIHTEGKKRNKVRRKSKYYRGIFGHIIIEHVHNMVCIKKSSVMLLNTFTTRWSVGFALLRKHMICMWCVYRLRHTKTKLKHLLLDVIAFYLSVLVSDSTANGPIQYTYV